MVMIVWQVMRQPRRLGAKLSMAKETSYEDMDGRLSFASFLRARAPLVEDEELLQVNACTDGTFKTSFMSITLDTKLNSAGDAVALLKIPGMSFFRFIVQTPQPEEKAPPQLLAAFFQRVSHGEGPAEVLSLPKRRAEDSPRCIDSTYNFILTLWADLKLGFPQVDGVHHQKQGAGGIGRGAALVQALSTLLDYVAIKPIRDRLDHRHIGIPACYDLDTITSYRTCSVARGELPVPGLSPDDNNYQANGEFTSILLVLQDIF